GFAQQADQPLRLAQSIRSDQMGALREQRHRFEQLGSLVFGRRKAKYRQAEGRLADEQVAWHRLEGLAGGISATLVIATNHGGAVLPAQHHLSRSQDMSRRNQGDADT